MRTQAYVLAALLATAVAVPASASPQLPTPPSPPGVNLPAPPTPPGFSTRTDRSVAVVHHRRHHRRHHRHHHVVHHPPQ
jgi:hypothetical protein